MSETDCCPICLEAAPQRIALGCSHGICPSCLLATFHATDWTCPLCRLIVPHELRGPVVLSLLPDRPSGWSCILARDPTLLDWEHWLVLLSSVAPLHWSPDWFEPLVAALRPWSLESDGERRRLPQRLWYRLWELLQAAHAEAIYPALWELGTDWIRGDTPCSVFAVDDHWRRRPSMRPHVLRFLARLFEEQHPAVQSCGWARLREFIEEPLRDLSAPLAFPALCVVANWACRNPARGEELRRSPVWPVIWHGLEHVDPISAAAFQVLCNAAGPALDPPLEVQWRLLRTRFWQRGTDEFPVLLLRRTIHLGARLLRRGPEDLFRTARLGILAELVARFARHPEMRADVAACFASWREGISPVLWEWIAAASGWAAAQG